MRQEEVFQTYFSECTFVNKDAFLSGREQLWRRWSESKNRGPEDPKADPENKTDTYSSRQRRFRRAEAGIKGEIGFECAKPSNLRFFGWLNAEWECQSMWCPQADSSTHSSFGRQGGNLDVMTTIDFLWQFDSFKTEVVRYLLANGADVNAEDQFKNTCLNDAVRHKWVASCASNFSKTVGSFSCQVRCYFSKGLLKLSFRWRHDATAQVLFEHGAKLIFDGNTAGVLLCEVWTSHGLTLSNF